MPYQWKVIEEELRREATAASAGAVAELAKHAPTLARFADAMDVIAHLHAIEGSDEERDLLLAELVAASKNSDAPRNLARTLLWLALWPGLTATLRRTLSRRRAIADADDIAADLTEKLALAIARFDHGRASKTAATLLLNTRRLFWASLKERAAWIAFTVPIRKDDYSKHAELAPSHADLVGAICDLRRGARSDAELVLAAVVEGESAREVSLRYGVAHEAIKKRIQRALLRCRTREAGRRRSRVPLSASRTPMGVKGKKTKLTAGTAGRPATRATASMATPGPGATEPLAPSSTNNERGPR